MAIAIDLSAFNDWKSGDPYFSFDGPFSTQKKITYWLDVWIFGKMHHQILFFLALRLSVWQFYKVLLRIKFCCNIGNI